MTICMGYFNLHLDNSNEEKPDKFNEMLTSDFSAAGISDHLAVISENDGCKTKWNKDKISVRKNKQN